MNFYDMNVGTYLEFRLEEMKSDLRDLIYSLGMMGVDFPFTAGKITELQDQIVHLENDLAQYNQEDDENF